MVKKKQNEEEDHRRAAAEARRLNAEAQVDQTQDSHRRSRRKATENLMGGATEKASQSKGKSEPGKNARQNPRQ